MEDDKIWDFNDEVEMFKTELAFLKARLDKTTRELTAFAQFLQKHQNKFTKGEIRELMIDLWNAEK